MEFSDVSTPRMPEAAEEKLRVLSMISGRFESAGIRWALGASAMLYFRGLSDSFHDLDLMVATEDAPAARDILRPLGTLLPDNRTAQYRTKYFYEFTIDGVDVDLIGGFAIVKDGVVHDCSFRPDSVDGSVCVCGRVVPLQSLAVWRGYYERMGRTARVRQIDSASR